MQIFRYFFEVDLHIFHESNKTHEEIRAERYNKKADICTASPLLFSFNYCICQSSIKADINIHIIIRFIPHMPEPIIISVFSCILC